MVVGSGGREHALAWKLAASPKVAAVHAAPGNPGMAGVATCHPVDTADLDGLVALAEKLSVGLVVVGPEAPLVAGLADRLTAAGIPVFGPDAKAARLEGSKGYMKDLAARAGVPTATYRRFEADALDAARDYIRDRGAPIVVKADGLAAGKGVTVAATVEEALSAVEECLAGDRFGQAGHAVVIEDCLTGPELSYFALVDGETVLPFGTAQDFKRAYDGDTGPNTGGMGVLCPHPLATPGLEETILETCVRPLARTMAAEGTPYRGVFYAGIMLTPDGPSLLEVNARFGDPECQALMVALADDLAPLLAAAATGKLGRATRPTFRDGRVTALVLAAEGYPDRPVTGYRLDPVLPVLAAAVPGGQLFHAGTSAGPNGGVIGTGGRVLTLVGAPGTAAPAPVLPPGLPLRFRRDIAHRG